LAVTILLPVLILHLPTGLTGTLPLHGAGLHLLLTGHLGWDRIGRQNDRTTDHENGKDAGKHWDKRSHGLLL
jgi:hypothetical protein